MNEPTRPPLPTDPRPAAQQDLGSWSVDTMESLRSSRRIAWIVAIVAGSVAVLQGLALVFLTPLKTVVPYAITVDRQTGYVETARRLEPGVMSQNAAVTQSFIVQYVLARETYDTTDLSDNYRKTMLFSAGDARALYQRAMQRDNPDSPLNLYPASSVLSTTIRSVSLLTENTALVRFETMRRDAGAASGETRAWTAVLAFRYTDATMNMGDRFLNPLGFQVVRYRRDADTSAGTSAPVPFATTTGLR